MNKILMSVGFIVALVVIGVATDPGIRGKVFGAGKQAVAVATVINDAGKIVSQDTYENSFQSIVQTGEVRVAVESPSKPFFYDDNGTPKGFNIDFLKLALAQPDFTAQHPNIKIVPVPVDTYPDVPKQLLKKADGKFVADIAIDGLTFSDDDLPGVVYTDPYVDDFGYAVITAPGSNIKSIDDLSGKTVGILKGDPDVKAFTSHMLSHANRVELSDESIDGERSWINHFIKSGKVDAVIYDYPFGVAEIDGTDLQFAVSKIQDSNLAYKIGVRKEDTELIRHLNSAIAKVRETPEYGALLRKYFMSNKIVTVKAAGGETKYTVKPNDTLSKIARTLLGSEALYTDIESRNNLPNPNLIQVGQVLIIPRK